MYVVNRSAFDFPPDTDAATEVKAALDAGTVMHAAHSAGYVATPAALAEEIVRAHAWLAGPPFPLRVLEPSAGNGRLVEAVLASWAGGTDVTAVEPDDRRAAQLPADRVTVERTTIEQYAATEPDLFDRVIMNPPFAVPGAPTLWATHLLLAWRLLAPGGRLVAILPASALRAPRGTDVAAARALITEHGEIEALPDGAFAESGTGIATAVAWLDKPPAADPVALPDVEAPYLARTYSGAETPVRVSRLILTRGAAQVAPVQVFWDAWRAADRVLRYWGDCLVCSRPTWGFDDGENDPRGVLGDASGGDSQDPTEYELVGPVLCVCSLCANDGSDANRRAMSAARERWWQRLPA